MIETQQQYDDAVRWLCEINALLQSEGCLYIPPSRHDELIDLIAQTCRELQAFERKKGP